MKLHKDWILDNIKKIIREKNLKVENVSKAVGISSGEFSKIINGQRINYYEHLPKIAEVCGVTFHELVKQESSVIQNNHHQEGGTAIANSNNLDKLYVDKLVSQCQSTIISKDETIKTLTDLLTLEREAKENYKRKYEKMKVRLQEIETKS